MLHGSMTLRPGVQARRSVINLAALARHYAGPNRPQWVELPWGFEVSKFHSRTIMSL
jgi:hypothetical protein